MATPKNSAFLSVFIVVGNVVPPTHRDRTRRPVFRTARAGPAGAVGTNASWLVAWLFDLSNNDDDNDDNDDHNNDEGDVCDEAQAINDAAVGTTNSDCAVWCCL